MFNSAAVDVIAVPLIASLSVTTLNVPLSSTLATSVPSLCWNIKSLDELVILSISVPSSLKLKSPPSASKTISPDESKVISVPSFVIVSRAILPILVISESLKSKVPVTSKFPSTVKLPSIVAFAPLRVIAAVGVEPDLITSSPLEFVKLPKVEPLVIVYSEHLMIHNKI